MIKPDWSTAPEWAQYWAIDDNGDAYWYGKKPDRGDGEWRSDGNLSEDLDNRAPFWKESLEKRP